MSIATVRPSVLKDVAIVAENMRKEDVDKVKEIYADRPEEIGEFKEEWPFENWIDLIYGD